MDEHANNTHVHFSLADENCAKINENGMNNCLQLEVLVAWVQVVWQMISTACSRVHIQKVKFTSYKCAEGTRRRAQKLANVCKHPISSVSGGG